MNIDQITIGERHRKDLGNVEALATSIDEIGLLHPVVVRPDGILIAGQRRLAACRLLGWTDIPVTVIDLDSVVRGEHDENILRKDFTITEIIALGNDISITDRIAVGRQELEPRERAAAKERQGTRTDIEPSGNFPEGSASRAIDRVASAVGMSRPTYEKAKAVIDSGDDALITEMDDTGKVDGVYKRLPHVAQATGENEWYTPAPYIKAAVEVMGAIDLDPASTDVANTIVGANKIFTIDDNGLDQRWSGRIFMNPPYSSSLIGRFAEKLATHVEAGDVKEAIVLVNNATETIWFHRLISVASAICFPRGRVKFWAPGRVAAPLQGQAVIYVGRKPLAFKSSFRHFGWIAEL